MLNAWQIFIQKQSFDEFFLRLPLTGDGADCRVPHPFAAIGRGSEWALPTRWLVETAADSLSWILSQAQLLQLSVDQYHSVRCWSIVKMGTQPGRIFTGMSRMGEFWPIAARRRSIPPQYGTDEGWRERGLRWQGSAFYRSDICVKAQAEYLKYFDIAVIIISGGGPNNTSQWHSSRNLAPVLWFQMKSIVNHDDRLCLHYSDCDWMWCCDEWLVVAVSQFVTLWQSAWQRQCVMCDKTGISLSCIISHGQVFPHSAHAAPLLPLILKLVSQGGQDELWVFWAARPA